MSNTKRRLASAVLSLLMLAVPALSQGLVEVPVGTVIALSMDTYSSSDSSRVGDRFTATVFRAVQIQGRTVIEENVKVEGHVTGTSRSERGSNAGMLAVVFDKIVFHGRNSVAIEATLTTLSEEGRRLIDKASGSREGAPGSRLPVVFLGSREGVSARIGVAGGRAESRNAGGILGTLTGEGDNAEVKPGTQFGMRLERALILDSLYLAGERDFLDDKRSITPIRSIELSSQRIFPLQGDRPGALGLPIFNSPAALKIAQVTLQDRGYYSGPLDGTMNQTMWNAVRQFQRDNRLTDHGNLDTETARALGIAADSGIESIAIGNARRIAFLAGRLLQDVQNELGVRTNGDLLTFNTRRSFKKGEVELLFQITSFHASAELYNKLTASITEASGIKSAILGLKRQAELLEQIIRLYPPLTLSEGIDANWKQLKEELARARVIDASLDPGFGR